MLAENDFSMFNLVGSISKVMQFGQFDVEEVRQRCLQLDHLKTIVKLETPEKNDLSSPAVME